MGCRTATTASRHQASSPSSSRRLRASLLTLLIGVSAALACAPGPHPTAGAAVGTQPAAATLANGAYAVIAAAMSPDSLPPAGNHTVILRYDGRYAGAEPSDPPEYLAVDDSAFVPLVLEEPPEARKDDRGWTMLSVTLRREHVKTLEAFTRAHLNGRVAIVLAGEVISTHKVRSVITDGRLQITRCGDNACEILRAKLAQ
jgi:hypothetical protein